MKLKAGGNVWYDWWPWGGIVRDVWLRVSDTALVRRQQIRVRMEGPAATVADQVFLENHGSKPMNATVTVRAFPPSGGPAVAETHKAVTLAPGAQNEALSLRIDGVQMWHFDHPNVYRMEVELAGAGVQDSITDNFGARTIEIRDRKMFLNGERVRLTGMTRHEESPWEGLAESAGTIKHDYDDLKDLQVTLTRPVHYPQHPDVLDYCDRHGILLIPEIPMWQFSADQMENPKVVSQAKQMMTEMIEQDFNHPSIFAWSACNESATDTPQGKAYFKAMYDMMKALDPDRYVTEADDRAAYIEDPSQSAGQLADFLMVNQYLGAWHGPGNRLPAMLEKLGRNFPDKMVIISEYGTPGVFASDAIQSDKLRVQILQDQTALFGKFDFIAGAIYWCYQDYKSHRNLWPGYTSGYVDHGVVDENRQRRPSYAAWKKTNAPARVSLDWQFPAGGNAAPLGFTAKVERRGADEMPSYALRGYRLTWEVRDDDGVLVSAGDQTLPEMGAPQIVSANWTPGASRSYRLSVRVLRPTGFVAAEETLGWWRANPGGWDVRQMEKDGVKVPGLP